MEYIEYMENGFHLTVVEISAYLRCSYQYIVDNIVQAVKHIRITEAAKSKLLKYRVEMICHMKMALYRLFAKRILFEEQDFQRYIRGHATMILSYRFYVEGLNPVVLEEIKRQLAVLN